MSLSLSVLGVKEAGGFEDAVCVKHGHMSILVVIVEVQALALLSVPTAALIKARTRMKPLAHDTIQPPSSQKRCLITTVLHMLSPSL